MTAREILWNIWNRKPPMKLDKNGIYNVIAIDQALVQAIAVLKKMKYNEPKNSSLLRERVIWTKGYDRAIDDVMELLK